MRKKPLFYTKHRAKVKQKLKKIIDISMLWAGCRSAPKRIPPARAAHSPLRPASAPRFTARAVWAIIAEETQGLAITGSGGRQAHCGPMVA
jgi:hypothetical protein